MKILILMMARPDVTLTEPKPIKGIAEGTLWFYGMC